MKEILTTDQPKAGTLVGTDQHGNKYFENRKDVANRDRWVTFHKWDFDATQIPPQWHQWLHKVYDDHPTSIKTPEYTYTHFENMTGTRGAYRPYNTVAPRLSSWNPKPRE